MSNSHRVAPYVCVLSAAFLGFVCLAAIGGLSELARDRVVPHRPDLHLRPPARFFFAYATPIRHTAPVAGALMLLVGVAAVRGAPTPENASRRAMWTATLISAFSGVALFGALVAIYSIFIGGVLMAASPH